MEDSNREAYEIKDDAASTEPLFIVSSALFTVNYETSKIHTLLTVIDGESSA